MRHIAMTITTAALLALAGPVLAQDQPRNLMTQPQPPTPNVPNPSSGTANSSAGVTRPGPNAGNSSSMPEQQRGGSADPSARTTEAPSLEMRQVGPDQRPDQTPPRR
ncbi:MAG: hypothetical protein JWP20_1651 [Roseomonas sp.]|jgi:hypothetical protein|nr:hypothetical protein [Roseomonas sp.]